MKVLIDNEDPTVQIYGKYRYDTEFGNLYHQSHRKYYPDNLSQNRTEDNIKDAIKNYKNELDQAINEIKMAVANGGA